MRNHRTQGGEHGYRYDRSDEILPLVFENPASPAALLIDCRERMSTTEWLESALRKLQAGESTGLNDIATVRSLAAIGATRGMLRDNFEEYIKCVSTFASVDVRDEDGSRWLWVSTEWLTEVQLLGILAREWNKYHPYVMTEVAACGVAKAIHDLVYAAATIISLAETARHQAGGESAETMPEGAPARVPKEGDPPIYDDDEEEEHRVNSTAEGSGEGITEARARFP